MASRRKPSQQEARGACCMLSEILEEAGLNRAKARALRRQLLQGVILLCQWQLERMDRTARPAGSTRATSAGAARRVVVE